MSKQCERSGNLAWRTQLKVVWKNLDAVPLDAVPLDAVPLDAVQLDAVQLDAVQLDAVLDAVLDMVQVCGRRLA